MEEKIYTIPVNEAFEETDGCPFCRLFRKLEDDELDLILGASMMEPDVRQKTNKLGFCGKHNRRMFGMKNRLGMGLMMESHLAAIRGQVETKASLFTRDAGAAQPYFFLPHYARYIKAAQIKMSKKVYGDFLKALNETEMRYFDKLSGDISWFCKKFDYRYDSEPWGDSKDAIERAIAFLSGCE